KSTTFPDFSRKRHEKDAAENGYHIDLQYKEYGKIFIVKIDAHSCPIPLRPERPARAPAGIWVEHSTPGRA
ncbi:hypothetical protein, partial [uncultured Desulfovibrio sp.]|uniref:hypothetical protein n=1 Tax=uncultured Desulfovibrio sp. TaxID=167968 RepID=UPI002803FEA1